MDELDIASFAEGLVAEEVTKGSPVQFAAPQPPDAPDISRVDIPEDFTAKVLSESFNIEEESPRVSKEIRPQVPITEASVYKQHLLDEYKKKVQDLEELVNLMESMGMGSSGAQVGVSRLSAPPMGVTKQRKKKNPMGGPHRKKKTKKFSGGTSRTNY